MLNTVQRSTRHDGIRGSFDRVRGNDDMTDERYVLEVIIPDAIDALYRSRDYSEDDLKIVEDEMRRDRRYVDFILNTLHNEQFINTNYQIVEREVINATIDILHKDVIPAIADEIEAAQSRNRNSRWSTESRYRDNGGRWNNRSRRSSTSRERNDRRSSSSLFSKEDEDFEQQEHDSHAVVHGITSDDVVFRELPKQYTSKNDIVTLDGYSLMSAENADEIVGLENMPCVDITVNVPIDGPWQVPNLIRRYGKSETFNKLFPHDRSIVMHIKYQKIMRLGINHDEYESIRLLVAKLNAIPNPTCEILLTKWDELELVKQFENMLVRQVNARIARYFNNTSTVTYLHQLTEISNDISCPEDKVARALLKSINDIFSNPINPLSNLSKIRLSDNYGAFCDTTGNDTELVNIVTGETSSQTLDRIATQYMYTSHTQTAIVTNVKEDEIDQLMKKIQTIKETKGVDVPVNADKNRYLITHIMNHSLHGDLTDRSEMPITNVYMVKCVYNPLEYNPMRGFAVGSMGGDKVTLRFFYDDRIVSPKASLIV